jgi:hypothetical protein
MLDGNRKPEGEEIDPAKMEQLLEIELMQKRAAWQQAKAKRNGLRALSFFFLFLVVIAALVGFFVFFSPERVNELKSLGSSDLHPSPSPAGSP